MTAKTPIFVLDSDSHRGRDLTETAQAAGLATQRVPDLGALVANFREGKALVCLLAFESLWPLPQEAIRRLRQKAPSLRVIVAYHEGAPRQHLGQRLWAVNLIDHFIPRSLPPHELEPILKQAHADAVIERAAGAVETVPSADMQRAAPIRFVHDLCRALNNQRRVEELLRLVHRKLPFFLDYLALQVLLMKDSGPEMHLFPALPLEQEVTWKLARATCAAVRPFVAEAIVPEDLDIKENAPFAPDADGPSSAAALDDYQPLVLPMVVHGELAGCIGLLLSKAEHRARKNHAMLRLIANQLGASIGNVLALKNAQDASLFDELTGLHNRRFLGRALASEWNRAQRYHHELSVAMLDLDHFKTLNDTHGHLVGDAILSAFGEVARRFLRDTDHIIRYGGEEFLLLLPQTGASEAAMVVERIRLALKKEPVYSAENTGHILVSFSAGLATHPVCSAVSADDLVSAADHALLAAKSAGRDRTCTATGDATIQEVAKPAQSPKAAPRRFPRISAELNVRFVELPDFEGQMVHTVSQDLSQGGVAIEDPDRRLKPYSYALVFVSDVDNPVLSRVVWTHEDESANRTAGLRFVATDEIEARARTTQSIKMPPRALVVATQQQSREFAVRVLTAAQYDLQFWDPSNESLTSRDLARCSLIIATDSAMRDHAEPLRETRAALRSPSQLVIVDEGGNPAQAMELITTWRPEHFVPLDEAAEENLFAVLNKLRAGEYYGLSKYLLWGVTVSSWQLSAAEDKDAILNNVMSVAEEVNCHPRVRDLLSAAIDEMLLLLGLGSTTRNPLLTVECGTDGRLLGVAVSDTKGNLSPEGLFAAIEAEATQSGQTPLRLRSLVANLSHLAINIDPGQCTEMIGIVDLRRSLRAYRRAAPMFSVFAKST